MPSAGGMSSSSMANVIKDPQPKSHSADPDPSSVNMSPKTRPTPRPQVLSSPGEGSSKRAGKRVRIESPEPRSPVQTDPFAQQIPYHQTQSDMLTIIFCRPAHTPMEDASPDTLAELQPEELTLAINACGRVRMERIKTYLMWKAMQRRHNPQDFPALFDEMDRVWCLSELDRTGRGRELVGKVASVLEKFLAHM